MVIQFIYSALFTLGFVFLFNIPKRYMVTASIVGGLGWATFFYFNSESILFACFLGSLVVAFVSEIFSRIFKEAVIIFVIPGILPLVPGSGMYNTVLAVIENDFTRAATVGSETLFMAGSIAVAILIVSSFFRLFVTIRNRFSNT